MWQFVKCIVWCWRISCLLCVFYLFIHRNNLHWTVTKSLMLSRIGNGSLTHWGRVTHICVSKLSSIVSDNGLSPGRRQAIIWTNAALLLIGPLGTNFVENLIEIHIFSFRKMYFKMSSGKWRPFCLGLNVLRTTHWQKLLLDQPWSNRILQIRRQFMYRRYKVI